MALDVPGKVSDIQVPWSVHWDNCAWAATLGIVKVTARKAKILRALIFIISPAIARPVCVRMSCIMHLRHPRMTMAVLSDTNIAIRTYCGHGAKSMKLLHRGDAYK